MFCDYCGKEYKRDELSFIENENTFCCNDCMHKNESYVVSCEYCGKEFDRNEVTFLEDECAFCCDECMKNKTRRNAK